VKVDRRDLLAHLLLAAAIVLVAWPLVAGQVLYYGDLTLQFIPWRSFARAELLAGRLPLWLPDTYLGLPFLANDQSAVLYPWHWLSLPLSPARQVALGCLVHLQLAASGMYCCTRRRERSRAAALCSALAFGLGGFILTKQQFPSLAYTIAWLPWLAWSAQRLHGRGLLVAATVVGVQWLAGHAQMSVMMLALVTGWQLLRPGGQGQRVRWLLAVGWGTGLAAVQLLPTAELLRWSARTHFELADAARFNLPPWQMGQALLPGCFGRPDGPLPYFGVGAFWETSWWIGLVALTLACAAGARRPAWLALAAVGLLLAMGIHTPVYPGLARLLPVLTIFRDPARFALYAGFALAWLAADGYDLRLAAARRWAAIGAGLAGLGWLLAALLPATFWSTLASWALSQAATKSVGDLGALAAGWQSVLGGQLLGAAAVLGLVAALATPQGRRWLPAVLAVELVLAGQGVNPATSAAAFGPVARPAGLPAEGLIWAAPADLEAVAQRCFGLAQYPSPPRVAEARAAWVGNLTIGTGVRQFAGYDPLRPAESLAWLEACERLAAAERQKLLAGLGCRGELVGGTWRPYPQPAAEVRRDGAAVGWAMLTPQRMVAESSAEGRELAWTRHFLPGWRWSGAARLAHRDAAVVAWETAPGQERLRTWYAPVTVRLGLFQSLVATALLAAGIVTCCSRPPRDLISS